MAIASYVSGWVARMWGSRVAMLAEAAILLVATACRRRSAFRAAVLPVAA